MKGSIRGSLGFLEDHGAQEVGYNWGYKSPKWGYPNYSLVIYLITKSHEPLSQTQNPKPLKGTLLQNPIVPLKGTPKPELTKSHEPLSTPD